MSKYGTGISNREVAFAYGAPNKPLRIFEPRTTKLGHLPWNKEGCIEAYLVSDLEDWLESRDLNWEGDQGRADKEIGRAANKRTTKEGGAGDV